MTLSTDVIKSLASIDLPRGCALQVEVDAGILRRQPERVAQHLEALRNLLCQRGRDDVTVIAIDNTVHLSVADATGSEYEQG